MIVQSFGTIVLDPPWRYSDTNARGAAEYHYPTMSIAEILRLPIPDLAAIDAHIYMWATGSFLPAALSIIESWGFNFIAQIDWIKTGGVRSTLVDELDAEKGTVRRLRHFVVEPELVKIQIGNGHYVRHGLEHLVVGARGVLSVDQINSMESCLLAVRGHSTAPVRNMTNVIFAPSKGAGLKHSQKPELVQDVAELISPANRLEMFARRRRENWITWGNEIERDAVRTEEGTLVPLDEFFKVAA